MAATMASTTMAVLNANCLLKKPAKQQPISLLSIQNNLPKGLISSKASSSSQDSIFLSKSLVAGAIFSTLSSCDAAFAAQQIAELAEGDNRGLALLLPIIPAIAWVLFNILQPALNQINKMRSTRGIIIGLAGLGGMAALMHPPQASASSGELAAIAEAAANDNRGTLLLLVIAPAIGWVLFNILQPALNQINRMRS
ncbi:OLC1v1028776C1 [Oldenlandia corymbosa var. corymbosa]|uniref:OLC1v1028776C1 n=1 Tax=Oldenlandia corymbosa var. corymbosa TaxID=529605 RepID=A0AAV1CDA9_OLDCO|nr:OLC1v1028776C1 [Oldenlandia corymbosa var. corymbosa]